MCKYCDFKREEDTGFRETPIYLAEQDFFEVEPFSLYISNARQDGSFMKKYRLSSCIFPKGDDTKSKDTTDIYFEMEKENCDYDVFQIRIPIKYCPFCGRELEGAENIEV